MGTPWDTADDDTPWSDRDAWRGDAHPEREDAWRGVPDGAPIWASTPDEDDEFEVVEIELVELPEEEWPEDLAGPEYWLFKRDGM
jgi:hypothetical protein